MAARPPRSTDDDVRAAGSFRDPSGFVFERRGAIYRQVNLAYRDDYDRKVGSGLARSLIDDGLLIPHAEVDEPPSEPGPAYKVLRAERVPFLSYPYEWCFGQLKAAALLTLDLQRRSLARGMSLKDASAFNVQFVGGRPIFIDVLSFEAYREGEPWVAYRQFCQHFLAPLALMGRVNPRLIELFRPSLDGVPLDLAAKLLPLRSWLDPRLVVHLHLHARAQRAYGRTDGGGGEAVARSRFPKRALLGLLDSLEHAVASTRWDPAGTEWADYYDDNSYTDAAADHKARLVDEYLDLVRPAGVWDLGANTGRYARLASGRGIPTVAMDVDPACVERNYRAVVDRGEPDLLPLRVDLMNPSPALGWDHRERLSLEGRGPCDLGMALALVHHLAIANNVPLGRVAGFLRRSCRSLIVEFVPKGDPQVRRLLAGRADIFDGYTPEGFEAAFVEHFAIERSERLVDSDRTLHLMRARPD